MCKVLISSPRFGVCSENGICEGSVGPHGGCKRGSFHEKEHKISERFRIAFTVSDKRKIRVYVFLNKLVHRGE